MEKNAESDLNSPVNHGAPMDGDTDRIRPTITQPNKAKGCAIRFWESVRVVLIILWMGIGGLLLVASIGVLRPEEREMYGFWGVVGLLWLFFIVFYGVSAFIRLLLRFVTKLLRKMA